MVRVPTSHLSAASSLSPPRRRQAQLQLATDGDISEQKLVTLLVHRADETAPKSSPLERTQKTFERIRLTLATHLRHNTFYIRGERRRCLRPVPFQATFPEPGDIFPQRPQQQLLQLPTDSKLLGYADWGQGERKQHRRTN